jgi:hypothetical protein
VFEDGVDALVSKTFTDDFLVRFSTGVTMIGKFRF